MGLAPTEQLKWSNTGSSLLAGICVVTGFTNVWRFPELMVDHGGMAFLLAYVVTLACLAFPVIWLQWRLGRRFRGTSVVTLVKLGQVEKYFSLWHLAGGMMVLACGLTAGVYVLVSGVTMAYLFKAALGAFSHASLADVTATMADLQQDALQMVAWFTIFLILIYGVSSRGLIRGIQRSLPSLVGILLVLFTVMVGYSFFCSGYETTWELLFMREQSGWSADLLMDAFTQAFFSLALGTGVHFILGAYCCCETGDTGLIAKILAVDLLTGIAATLMVLPVVAGANLEMSSGFALIFQTMPVALHLLPWGQLFLALFYVLFTVVALTSLLFLVEPAVLWFQVRYGMKRRISVLLVFLFLWAFAVLVAQSMVAIDRGITVMGMSWFTFMQFLVSSVLLPLSLLFVLVLVGYVLPRSRLAEGVALSESNPYFLAFYRWIRYVLIPVVFLVQIYALLGLSKHMCFLGPPYIGSICSSL
jgi:NSS family neurotransmitter:Na+ symporter